MTKADMQSFAATVDVVLFRMLFIYASTDPFIVNVPPASPVTVIVSPNQCAAIPGTCSRYLPSACFSGITVSTAPMIGPTFLPGHSADYSEFFEVNAQTYQHVSGVSQSLGVVMYHIASEISLEAFRLLTGKGSLKYVDCIYTEDVINGKEMILYPKKSKLRTQEQERPVLNMAVWILMLLIVLTAVLTNCIPVMFLNYIICLASPFLIYRTREKTARAALTNIIVFFPVYAAVMLIKTPLFHAHGLLEICSVGISVFTVFSFMIVFSQLIVNILYRKQK